MESSGEWKMVIFGNQHVDILYLLDGAMMSFPFHFIVSISFTLHSGFFMCMCLFKLTSKNQELNKNHIIYIWSETSAVKFLNCFWYKFSNTYTKSFWQMYWSNKLTVVLKKKIFLKMSIWKDYTVFIEKRETKSHLSVACTGI